MSEPCHVLVIDDNEQVRYVVRCMLEAAGYTVHEAPDGHAGLLFLENRRCDLVLCDLMMPGMTGPETCARIRESFPETHLIAISGAEERECRRLAGDAPALTKPFTFDELMEAVEGVLDAD